MALKSVVPIKEGFTNNYLIVTVVFCLSVLLLLKLGQHLTGHLQIDEKKRINIYFSDYVCHIASKLFRKWKIQYLIGYW